MSTDDGVVPRIKRCPNPKCKGRCAVYGYSGSHQVECGSGDDGCGYRGPEAITAAGAVELHNAMPRAVAKKRKRRAT
jgi:hypothetical protein